MNIRYHLNFILFIVSSAAFLFFLVALSSMKADIAILKKRVLILEQTKSQVNEMVMFTLDEHDESMEDLYTRIRILESRRR